MNAVLPHLPQGIRGTLLDQLRIICPILHNVDSASEGADHFFSSIHFSYYNRYSNRVRMCSLSLFIIAHFSQGDGTPSDAEPTTLLKNNKRKRTNTCQNIPRRSNELKDNIESYCMLQDAFKPLFEWLEEQVYLFKNIIAFLVIDLYQIKVLLPETYISLSHFVDILPYSDVSPVYPFGGFVVNINVTTKIHRDHGDHDICVVVALSDCTGGELCLFEPGLVLELQHGDVVIFASADISHFNLHYQGFRASLICHSDKSGLAWAEDRNGWSHNDFMRTIQNPSIYILDSNDDSIDI